MSSSNESPVSENREKLPNLNTASWSIKGKILLNFLIRAVVAISLMVFAVYLAQRKQVMTEARERLLLLSNTKSQYLKTYFLDIEQQVKALATDRFTLEAFNQFNQAFTEIDTENFYTPASPDLASAEKLLRGFYTAEILPRLEETVENRNDLSGIVPADKKQVILQYLYLAGNSKPLGAKSMLTKADDGSTYSFMHAQYHPDLLRYARERGFADIYFVDYKTGYVTYSLQKNFDFASNLFTGPYKNSGLAMAFKSAIAQSPQSSPLFVDASLHLPAFSKPCVFVSVPVFNESILLGAIIVSLDISSIDRALIIDKEGTRGSNSLKAILVGDDLYYRCNDPELLTDQARYVRRLKYHASKGSVAAMVDKHRSTAMIQQVDEAVFSDALQGKERTGFYRSETGEHVICSYRLLTVGNLRWIFITQMNRADALAPVNRFAGYMAAIALMIAVLLYFISRVTNRSIALRISELSKKLWALANGEKVKIAETPSTDEIGQAIHAVGKISRRIQEASLYLADMSKGSELPDFKAESEEDQFALALNNLKRSLILQHEEDERRKKEDEIRNWTTNGIAMFNDILRTDNVALETLAFNITKSFIQYLNAAQGGLFLVEDDQDEPCLNLVASYAYDRQKFITKRIAVGEGLAGNCVLEKKTVLLTNVPEDYMEVTSGLGGSRPSGLMIVPLKKDDQVLGVLELASLSAFKPYEVDFVERVAESIAATLITVTLHRQTSRYLETMQQQTEAMKAQDEELRQNIEELQATHEQMERLKQEENERNQATIREMETYRRFLISVLDQIPGKIFVKDHDGRILLLNSEVAKVYNKTVDELLGTTDFDNHSLEDAQEYRAKELEIISQGAETYIQEESLTGTKRYLKTTKMPFALPHLNTTGLMGIQIDITDIMEIEQEIRSKSEELQKETALLNALLDNIPDLIYFKDKESRFLRFSKSLLSHFNLGHNEDLLGKTDFDFVDADMAKGTLEDEQRIIQTGEAMIDREDKEIQKDNSVSWASVTKMPLRNAQGEIMGTFGISKDITRIKNLEIEARDLLKIIEGNRKLLIDILNKIPAKIFVKDENGVFVVVNDAVASVYAKTPEEIIGTSDYDNHPDEDVDSWRAQELEIVAKGQQTYVHLEKQQDKSRYLNTTKMPFPLATTGKTGLLGMQFDVTELKLMEQKVAELKTEMEGIRKGISKKS